MGHTEKYLLMSLMQLIAAIAFGFLAHKNYKLGESKVAILSSFVSGCLFNCAIWLLAEIWK